MLEGKRAESPRSGGPSTETTFSDFYRANFQPVASLAYVLSGSWTVAEEVAQESFLRALARWDGQLQRPEAWVREVAANLARSRLRRFAAEARALTRRGQRWEHGPGMEPVAPELESFWTLVRGLPHRQAQAVALRYLEDLTVADIAEFMGCAEGTVKALLHQARTRIAQQMDRNKEHDDDDL